MPHTAPQNHHSEELGTTPSAIRMSGLFTSSNLSLNVPEVDENDTHKDVDEVEQNHETIDEVQNGSHSNIKTSSLEKYSPTIEVPDRPMSSSEVLEAKNDYETDFYHLRRVYSDTTPPVDKKKKGTGGERDERVVDISALAAPFESKKSESQKSSKESSQQRNESTLI